MKKRRFWERRKFIGVILGCVTMATMLWGCGEKEEPAREITITLMNNQETVATITAFSDTPVEGYEEYETLEGYEFEGWYETPTFIESSRKDLATDTFSEDKILFGNYIPDQAAEDTRNWYIVGTGTSSILAATDWARVPEEEVKDICSLSLTGNVVNEFSITLDMYSGDQFQLIPDWDWGGQVGFGYITEYDASQLENGGGTSENKSNINVLVDGNYTITLTTNPDNMAQTILTIVRNGDVVGEE